MSFIYSTTWEDELLYLSSLKYTFEDENERLIYLVEQAQECNDLRVVKALLKALKNYQGGIEQTIYNALGTIDYHLYYTGVFQVARELFDSKRPQVVANILHWISGDDLDEKEYREIFLLIDQYLTIEDVKKYIKVIEDYGYADDEPYSKFLTYFKSKVKGVIHG